MPRRGRSPDQPIGDAVLLASTTPTAGVDLVANLLRTSAQLAGFPVIRAGLHHGPTVERNGDLFGTAVNLTARIAGHAAAGQTLATAEVADAARGRALPVRSIGPIEMRNLNSPSELFDVDMGLSSPDGAVDPVCRMWVAHQAGVGHLGHGGQHYCFCSQECAAAFASDPDRYAS